ncbi:MAG: DUF4250 domain-containing protein [Lachnospiraceae bacterium]|jgi:hypothetical protein|nr:DUF4250 domain-containing protein [Lachnospiraceae bacterium]
MNFPKDPVMLLSVVNTYLRDHDSSLEELCKSNDIPQEELTDKLSSIGCHYIKEQNQFVQS